MKWLSLVVCVALMSSCASIAHGRYQQVPINSNPAGASVTVNCGNGSQVAGVTPVTVNLKRNADICKVSVEKETFEPAAVTFARSVSGWIWGNIFFGGIPGWIIDAADGAMYNRVPDSIQVTLVKK